MSAVFFYLFGGMALLCGFATITRRDAVASAFWLIACFLNLAALYATLSAHFMAVLQVLVYAGAIMVFFLFVTMFLGEPKRGQPSQSRLIPLLAALTVLGLGYALLRIFRLETPEPPEISGSYGGVERVSELLLTRYLLGFELTGLLLLVAVIGAVLLARKVRATKDTQEDAAVLAAGTGEESHA